MPNYDAGSVANKSKRSARIFKDLNLDFQQNTATKDIQKMLDVESVKRSVRNLINLNHYRFVHFFYFYLLVYQRHNLPFNLSYYYLYSYYPFANTLSDPEAEAFATQLP